MSAGDVELHVGELIMYVGNPEHSTLKPRVIYQVVKKEANDSKFSGTPFFYRLRPAFDIQNPTGTELETTSNLSVRGMRRLSLVDVGTLRMLLDEFIKQWSGSQSVPPLEGEGT